MSREVDLETAVRAYNEEEEKEDPDAILLIDDVFMDVPQRPETLQTRTEWQRVCEPRNRRWIILSLVCAGVTVVALVLLLVQF